MILGYPEVEKPAEVLPYNETLRSKLEAYRSENNLSREQLGKRLGISGTAVSRYLNCKFEGNIKRFEGLAADFLKAEEQRKEQQIVIFDTSVALDIEAALHTIRKTNDIGLVTGNAGIGKSKAVERFKALNPTSIVISGSKWCRNFPEMVREFWNSIETSGWGGKVKKIDFILERFVDSNRLVILDNAHRFSKGGFEFIFDFYDATRCPIGMIGNPEVIERIQANDQQFSRIGLHTHVEKVEKKCKGRADGKEKELSVAGAIIQQIAPAFADCEDLAEKVIANKGHLRALRKLLSLADEIASKDSFKSKCVPEELHRTAFRVAHQHLIRNYNL
jgi:DNA transposition AAA+ family ATPase